MYSKLCTEKHTRSIKIGVVGINKRRVFLTIRKAGKGRTAEAKKKEGGKREEIN